jgi:hypothetical protein
MSDSVTYRIRDWKQHFESYEQSRLKAKDGMRWVTITTKHDGKTFRRLSKIENGIAIYGAWVLIVAVAGKCPVRGVLADAANFAVLRDAFPVYWRHYAALKAEGQQQINQAFRKPE